MKMRALLIFVLAAFTQTAMAQTETVDFDATVTTIIPLSGNGNALAASLGIAVGDPINGAYSYDVNHPDSNADPTVGLYNNIPDSFSMSLQTASTTYNFDSLSNRVTVWNQSFDEISAMTLGAVTSNLPAGTTVGQLQALWNEQSGTALADASLQAPPAFAWDFQMLKLLAFDDGAGNSFSLFADITAYSSNAPVDIVIDPGTYTGQWFVIGVTGALTGVQTVSVDPGVNVIEVASLPGRFNIDVAANGDITSLNTAAAAAAGNVLTFNTTPMTIDPAAFTDNPPGDWSVLRVVFFSNTPGPQTFDVVPALGYTVQVGRSVSGRFVVDVAANGDVTSLNTDAATVVGNTPTFNTTTINVDPGSYTGTWSVFGVSNSQSGIQELIVVPGVGYEFRAGSDARIVDVNNPCAIDPATFLLSGFTFEVVCGPIDSDGDGVPDDLDICPGGDDNDDADGDLVPDFCDPCPIDSDNDADGDGVCGDADVCPGGDDTLDADSDSTPDFCDVCPDDPENDADGDGICEIDDNCPLVANSGQGDNDLDSLGDACDPDDDNDTFDDDVDNCPLIANDQTDTDGDGAGDECDADDDNDGVIDADDQCPGTSLGDIVNADGCAVADLCPCEHPLGGGAWKNHGAYMRCVSHTSRDFVDVGLMTNQERDDIVSASAATDCGKK